MSTTTLPARLTAEAAPQITPDTPAITTPDSAAMRYRERAAWIRAVAHAFEADTPQNRTTELIVAGLVTAAADAEAMAGTLDGETRSRRIA